MNIIAFLLSILPLISCVFCLLILKRNIQTSALISLIITSILTILNKNFNIDLHQISNIIYSTLLLGINAGVVIISGLYFNTVLTNQGKLPKLVNIIKNINIDSEYKILILLIGILPALESLTGFGVCLLLGVPIYCSLMEAKKVAKISMLSMNIMPWGTLSLATVIGANLTNQQFFTLSSNTAIISSLIFVYFGVIALSVFNKQHVIKYSFFAIALGLSLPVFIYLLSIVHIGELSGVLAGLLTAGFGIFLVLIINKINHKSICKEKNNESIFSIIYPYLFLIVLVLITRLHQPLFSYIKTIIMFKSTRVSFAPLASPSILIFLVAIFTYIKKPVKINYTAILIRSKNTIIALCSFILISQIMLENNMISSIVQELKKLPQDLIYIISPFLGMFSGFLAGSGLGGNAMMMTLQQKIGILMHKEHLFTAIQNSTAGHTVFSSIAIILLVKTIMQEYADKESIPSDSAMLSFGLKVSGALFLVFCTIIWVVNKYNIIV